MTIQPVISNAAYCLVHVPDLVRYGSKPRREIAKDARFEDQLSQFLRSYSQALSYPPNQVFIGNLSPEELRATPQPWYESRGDYVARGKFGEMVRQETFYGILKAADVLEPALVVLDASLCTTPQPFESLVDPKPLGLTQTQIDNELASVCDALALRAEGRNVGLVRRDNRAEGRDDENLNAHTLLEGLCAKATASMALRNLLDQAGIGPEKIDYVIGCGEEATGDRYQRGGGGLAKAVGEMCGCLNASGMDIKNFCAAPASAITAAAALVATGLFKNVAVVAGGSLAKLGMKSEAFIKQQIPILDDCLASHAFLVTQDDHRSPIIRLQPGAIGVATIGSSTANEAIYRQLIMQPLESLGLKIHDIDKFAPELHNPEIMEYSGSGDVAHKNYRMIAATAIRSQAIEKSQLDSFVRKVGMPGYAPTQGHIPSGVAYIGHAIQNIVSGQMKRVMILSKASIFLNRLTKLYDGVSLILEANPGQQTEWRD